MIPLCIMILEGQKLDGILESKLISELYLINVNR
jgi:hypothetical protein